MRTRAARARLMQSLNWMRIMLTLCKQGGSKDVELDSGMMSISVQCYNLEAHT